MFETLAVDAQLFRQFDRFRLVQRKGIAFHLPVFSDGIDV